MTDIAGKFLPRVAGPIASLLLVVGCAGGPAGQGAFYPSYPRPEAADGYADYMAARYATLLNEPDVAALRYREALARHPDDVALLEQSVFAALMAGDFANASAVSRKSSSASDLAPAPVTLLTLGVAQLKRGRYRDALAALDSHDLGPFNGLAGRATSAWALAALGRADEAVARLAEPSGSPIVDALNDYSAALLLASVKRDDDALALFAKAWNAGARLPAAVDAYGRIAAARGDTDLARRLVDGFHRDLGDNPLVDQLGRDLSAGAEIAPPRLTPQQGAAVSLLGLTSMLASETESDVSVLYFELALALDPDQHAARILQADTLERAGRSDAAFDILGVVPSGSPFYAAARARQAWLRQRAGDPDGAKAAARSALESHPGRSVSMLLGDLYSELDDYQTAEGIFSRVAKEDAARDVADWRVVFAHAAAQERLGRWDEAEANLVKALKMAPDRPEILNYLGYSWIDRGEHIDAAFQLIRRAAAQRPGAGYIIDSLGWAHYRRGDYADARVWLERAAALDPSDPLINDHLGDAYWRADLKRLARYQWERVLLFEPDEETVRSVRAKLASGLPPVSGETP